MLTSDEIQALTDAAGKITNSINAYLIKDISERIRYAGKLTSTAKYEIYLSETLGVHYEEIKAEIAKWLKVSKKEIDDLLFSAGKSTYKSDIRNIGKNHLPFEENSSIQQIVKAYQQLTAETFENITQTIGMVNPYGVEHPLRQFYRSTIDYVFQNVSTGATDYNTALRHASTAIADKGVAVINYKSGVKTSLEAAVRRCIISGLGLMAEQISMDNHDKLGCDGWEMSAHAMSAPDHEPYQGRQYTDREWLRLNGRAARPGEPEVVGELKRRIGTLHCKHTASPVILGVNLPQYTQEQLAEFAAQNKKGVTIGGKHYTRYKASQKQRAFEATIRRWKRRQLSFESSGQTEEAQKARMRIANLTRNYKEFSRLANLRTQNDRLWITNKK